jgi:hypothetical protein
MPAATIARWLTAMPPAVFACVTARASVRQPGQHRAKGLARIASAVALVA